MGLTKPFSVVFTDISGTDINLTIVTFKHWHYSNGFDGNFPVVLRGLTSTANDFSATYDRLTMNIDIAAKGLIKFFSVVLTDTIGCANSFHIAKR